MSEYVLPWTRRVARQVAFAIVVGVSLRHLAPLVPPWIVVAFYLAGWAGAVAGGGIGSARGAVAAVAVSLATPFALAVMFRALLAWVPLSLPLAVEDRALLAAARLGPTGLLAGIPMAWEVWASRHRSGRILLAPVIVLLLLALFWGDAGFQSEVLGHPTWYAVLAAATFIALVAHQWAAPLIDAATGQDEPTRTAAAMPRAPGSERRRLAIAIPVVLATLVLLLVVFRAWQADATSARGGLMRPTAFRFDFADYITLEDEISQSRDLVMIYREDRMPASRLLRRYVLSGYSSRRGFYRRDGAEEGLLPPLSVARAAAGELPSPPTDLSRRAVSQGYYIVNFDPDALIVVNEPVAVERLADWPRSSFNGAFRVESSALAVTPKELRSVVWPEMRPDAAGAGARPAVGDPEWYRASEVPPRIAALAREVTADARTFYDAVAAIEAHLLENYYYSLSPGAAADGDQLSHFLFESRKGYCSYFAFAMALMARSVGIPARVAVGFFVDPNAGMLGFYPIRADMAHAWVEVDFGPYGWVEFDPTSRTVAPGEVVSTDYGIDPERLSALIEEILAQGRLETQALEPDEATRGEALARTVRRWLPAVAGVLVVSVAALVIGMRRRRWLHLRREDPARAARLVYGRTVRIVGSGPAGVPLARTPEPLARAASLVSRARFAPRFSAAECDEVVAACRSAVRVRIASVTPVRAVALRLRLLTLPRSVTPGVATRAAVVLLALGAALIAPAAAHAQRAPQPLPESVQLPPGPDNLESRINESIDAENYERALTLIRDARDEYPGDPRFPLIEGDLYFDQGVYRLARTAYTAALAAGAPEYRTRYALSLTLARLNEDDLAIGELERMRRIDPDDLDVIGDLAWLYFKRHRLQAAERLLTSTLADHPDQRDLRMTLATVRAGLWRYDDALRAYLEAIESAQRDGDRGFQSVAWYNTSILHANFYRWEESLAAAERSLEMADRASGYMIRGELHEQRLDLDRAVADYRRADALDGSTPLAALSEAALLVSAGYPDRGVTRLIDLIEADDGTWMYNFGTDPERYRMEQFAMLADAYRSRARHRRLYRDGPLAERLVDLVAGIADGIRAGYYRTMWRIQSTRVAREYERAGRTLNSHWTRMVATEHVRAASARHARAAAEIETAFNPESEVDYALYLARLEDDTDALRALLPRLEERWRRSVRATALREIYRLEGARRSEGRVAAADAWLIAPGSFLIEGLRIPLAVEIGARPDGVTDRRILRTLRRLGIRDAAGSPLVLSLTVEAGRATYAIRDRRIGETIRSGEVRTGVADPSSPPERADVRVLLEEVASRITTDPAFDSRTGEA